MIKFIVKIIGVCLFLVLPVVNAADISVIEAKIKNVLPGRTMTAAYMTLHNNEAKDVFLTVVHAPFTKTIEMHETRVVDGISRMRQQEKVLIPANSKVEFKRGGLHLMLFGVKAPLSGSADITLCFDDDTHKTVSFDIESW